MFQTRYFALAIVLFVLAPVSDVAAQPVPPGGGLSSPTFSPYLNLAARGGSPAVNYLGIVRPQLQMQQQFGQLQQQYQQSSQGLQSQLNQLSQGADPSLPLTGHVAVFNSTGPYFSRHPVTGGTGLGRGPIGMGTRQFGNNAGQTIGRAPTANTSAAGMGGGGGAGGMRR